MSDTSTAKVNRHVSRSAAEEGVDVRWTGQLPSGWWLAPAILLGSAIWAAVFIAVVRAIL